MSEIPLISICIPAYKNIGFLRRLLDSIIIQTFRNFEVVVTDDSPNLEINDLCETYTGQFAISYFRNDRPLGSPDNWNAAVREASGEWIKIMHDDDWFSGEHSLEEFARSIDGNPGSSFIFAAYRDIFLDEDRSREVFVNPYRFKAFLRNQTVLFARNIIGPPSVTIYKKEKGVIFDPKLRWLVDIEFYIRYLNGANPVYINKLLVNVGLGDEQVTRDCFRLRAVEIPENFLLLNKVGVQNLKNIMVYDAWWRLMRNLEIKDSEDISGSGYSGEIPSVILSMINWQKKIPLSLLKNGIFSKSLMFFHYILHINRIPS
ncbi:glycosyltransferase family 2 protein [Flavitalea flava]